MAELLKDVEYLSQEIGPRPAGTEEEQDAALYIADQVKKQTNLRAEIEDIKCIANPDLMNYIYFGAAALALLVSIIAPVAAVVCLIVSLLAVGLYVCEEILDKPLLSKILAKDDSQNVVTKYQPAQVEAPRSRGARRKIIVVANYDSGKVMKDLNPSFMGVMGPVVFASRIALLATPVLIFVKDVLFAASAGFLSLFFMVIALAAFVLLLVPIARGIMHHLAPYNEAANVNASGVAVLMEAMRQVSANGNIDIDAQLDAEEDEYQEEAEEQDSDEPVVHGEEAAVAAGVVEEGVELTYDDDVQPAAVEEYGEMQAAPQMQPELVEPAAAVPASAPAAPAEVHHTAEYDDAHYAEESPEERLLAAKAAIAGLTGAPVQQEVFTELEDNRANFQRTDVETHPTEEQIAQQRLETREALTGQEPIEEGSPAVAQAIPFQQVQEPEQPAAADNVPEWFKTAQEKAHRQPAPKKVSRSRYADALDVASGAESYYEKAIKAAEEEAAAKLQEMHHGMSQVKPPVEAAASVAAPATAVATTAAFVAAPAAAAVANTVASAPVAPVASEVAAATTAVANVASATSQVAPSPQPVPVRQVPAQKAAPAPVAQSVTEIEAPAEAPVAAPERVKTPVVSEPVAAAPAPVAPSAPEPVVNPAAAPVAEPAVAPASIQTPVEPASASVEEASVSTRAAEPEAIDLEPAPVFTRVAGPDVPADDPAPVFTRVTESEAPVEESVVPAEAASQQAEEPADAQAVPAEPEVKPIPQIDNAEMRAAVAAVQAERADMRPIFQREPLEPFADFGSSFNPDSFATAFGDKLVADSVRPAADLAALAAVPAVPEDAQLQADAGKTQAMAPVQPVALDAVPAVEQPAEEPARLGDTADFAIPEYASSYDSVNFSAGDAGKTQAMPALTDFDLAEDAPGDAGKTQAMPALRDLDLPLAPSADAGRTQAMPALGAQAVGYDGFQEVRRSRDLPGLDLPAMGGVAVADSAPYEELTNVVVENGVPRVVLPDPDVIPANYNAAEALQQRAPLAEAAQLDGQAAAKSLLSNRIPKISVSDLSGDLGVSGAQANNLSDTDKRANLFGNLPSLSGALDTGANNAWNPEGVPGSTGPVGSAGSTGAFAPVSEELAVDANPEELYVDDADDSVFEENMTQTGAFAGPDYVQMPKSRFHKLLGKFSRKKKDDMATPQEWLNVNEDFDARQVGKDRGDWSSFRDGSANYNDDEWRGGAFSRGRTLVDDSDPTEANDVIPSSGYEDEIVEEAPAERKNPFAGMKDKLGGLASKVSSVASRGEEPARERRSSRRVAQNREPVERPLPVMDSMPVDPEVAEELREVQQFQAGSDYNTEIWFVALGAEMSGHAGMKAFIKEHEEELRGSIVVNLEAMGAGHLSGITKEGVLKKHSPSTRLKRFLRNAAQLSGVTAGTAEMTWRDSTSSYAMEKGLQAISLVGMDGQKPALAGQSDDVLEGVSEAALKENSSFLMALLRSI